MNTLFHIKQEVRTALGNVNMKLIIILGGLTSTVQLAVACWNKPYKGHLTIKWIGYMQLGLKTPKENLKRTYKQDIMNLVSFA